MAIVVFWIETAGTPTHREFGDAELREALTLTEQLRSQGKRHVTISSELHNSVGRAGVDEVREGRLPAGDAYEYNKRHRGDGPKV
jgi:hypothetical protein